MPSLTNLISATPGPSALPRANELLTTLALEAARRAAPLLQGEDEMFLGLELDHMATLRIIWWRARDFKRIAEISASPEGFCPEDTEEGALQEAAADLLDYLAGRWPTPPAEFGVITDGRGVAFAPEHPAPSADGWLFRMASGGATMVTILPLDPLGPCAMLAQPAGIALH